MGGESALVLRYAGYFASELGYGDGVHLEYFSRLIARFLVDRRRRK